MSSIINGQVVLSGTAAEALNELSLYLTYQVGTSSKDVLFELSGNIDADATAQRWDVFVSYGRILKVPKERSRKLLFGQVTAKEAYEKIRDEVIRNYKGYSAAGTVPSWWKPIPPAEILQISPMLAMGPSAEGHLATLATLYDDDSYVLELKFDGHRAKAHFFADDRGAWIRFDSRRQSDLTGLFTENTESVTHLAMPENAKWADRIAEFRGTILDGEIIHSGGIAAVGSVMGAHYEKAVAFQQRYGYAKYIIFDCIAYQGELLTKMPWEERRLRAERMGKLWEENLDDRYRGLVEVATVWEGEQKRDVRLWASENGFEGVILKKRDSKYIPGGRSWDWVKDKKQQRFSCVIVGYEDSTSESYAPHGWIKCIKIGQMLDGKMTEIGQVGSMSVATRKWISENRARALGMVVDVEAQEQIKGTWALRHPRFVCFRDDIKPADCVVGQTG